MNMYMLINIASDILTFHGGTCDDPSLKKMITVESFKFVGTNNCGQQNFVGSQGRYFVGQLCDVTREDNPYLIYLQTSERVIFLIFYNATKQSYHSCKHLIEGK